MFSKDSRYGEGRQIKAKSIIVAYSDFTSCRIEESFKAKFLSEKVENLLLGGLMVTTEY
jgi:hypothetical protein